MTWNRQLASAVCLAVISLFALGSIQPLMAAESARLGDQVSGLVSLTEEERVALEPVLPHYYALNGSNPMLQEVIAACDRYGCRGSWIGEIVGIVVAEMKRGTANAAATRKVVDALAAVCGHCKEKGIVMAPDVLVRGVKARLEGGATGESAPVR